MSLRCSLAPSCSPPVRTVADAVRLTQLLTQPTDRDLLTAILLDRDHRPLLALDAPRDASVDPEFALLEVTMSTTTRRTPIVGVVLASVFVTASRAPSPRTLADTWLQLDALCFSEDLELIEWLVVTPSRVILAREAAGMPARWCEPGEPPG